MKGLDIEFPNGSTIVADSGHVAEDIVLREGTEIIADTIEIGQGVRIGAHSKIHAENIRIGMKSRIGDFFTFHLGSSKVPESFMVGDFTTFAGNIKMRLPRLSIGDYGSVNDHLSVWGSDACVIGHNFWIGQWTILNTRKELRIGNNCRLGHHSQFWTHVASGEMLEGCELFNEKELVIEDDVWMIGGHHIVPSGIVIGKKATILPGAMLTANAEPGHCYAGVPAKDITTKYDPYRKITPDEKFEMMKGFVAEFLKKRPEYRDRILVNDTIAEVDIPSHDGEIIMICMDHTLDHIPENISIFNISTKEYSKRRSEIEETFNRFIIGHRARFTPMDDQKNMQRTVKKDDRY
jgi:acetyltransferase-like isoleucine patch superfamily enzyme